MELVDIDVVDMAVALTLTLGVTEFIKRMAEKLLGPNAGQFAPLYALVSAAVVVAVLIDVSAATQQTYGLAVIVVTLSAVGIFSGVKNTAQGIQHAMPADTNAGER